MSIIKDKEKLDFNVTFTPSDGHKWSKEDREMIEERAKLRHSKRSPERLRKTALLKVLYRMQDYEQDNRIKFGQLTTVEEFVKDFCGVLGLGKTRFANHLDTDVSNLNKYLRGQRAFTTELAMKLAHFFHTPVDIWLKVQLKNNLIALHEEEKSGNKYEKYDYTKVLQMA